MTHRQTPPNRGVSEVIGYVIVLGVVLMSMGMVLNVAPGTIQDTQAREHMENTRQTFEIVQENFDEMVEMEVPARATEIRLYNAHLHTNREAHVNVTIGGEVVVDERTNAVVYEGEEGTVSYENGAIFTGSGGNESAMLHEPEWSFGKVNIIRSTLTKEQNSVSGDGTRIVTGRECGDGGGPYTADGEVVNVTIDSQHAQGWEGYFESLDLSYDRGPEVIEDGGEDGMDRFVTEIDASGQIVHIQDNICVEIS